MNPRKDLGTELKILTDLPGVPQGRQFWRTLEEAADSVEFQELMRLEFPEQADVWPDSLSRRRFLALMGASLALANLPGCSVKPAPMAKIVPYVKSPREMVPGKPLFFATAMPFAGTAVGLLVESHMGRPTKVEGNPDHPASLGATSVFHQASVLTLYDPDRSQTVTHLGRPRTWADVVAVLRQTVEQQRTRQGAGFHILSAAVISPALADQRAELLKLLPEAKWHVYEPIQRDSAHEGAKLAFGKPVNTYYDFAKADVVVSLDADFLCSGAGHLRYTADFMSRRRVRTPTDAAAQAHMNRLYVVETGVSGTGAKADHRLALRSADIAEFARALAAELGVPAKSTLSAEQQRWVTAIAKDLHAHRGRCLLLAGDQQPPVVHLLAHVLNQRLGNVGATVLYTGPIEAAPTNQTQSLRELVQEMEQGQVAALLILGSNPVYTAPVDFDFAAQLAKVPLRVHVGPYQDETAHNCHWHIPEAHYLEAWGDVRAYDGTASIVQPLIEPLYQSHSVLEVVTLLAGSSEIAGYEIVHEHWRRQWEQHKSAASFDEFWETSLHDGVIPQTTLPTREFALQAGWEAQLQQREPASAAVASRSSSDSLELVFQADPTIYDGSFANNGWLQELPKPLTKLTWDNAALMSPSLAADLGVPPVRYSHGGEHGGYQVPLIELRLGGRMLRAPAWIVPGHAERSITICLGYGRQNAGRVGGSPQHTVGFDAYTLRTAEHPWSEQGLTVVKTAETYLLACTQAHQLMENRNLVRTATLGEYQAEPNFAQAPEQRRAAEDAQRATGTPNFYQPHNYDPPAKKWGMVIDLTSCIGCNACVVACQAENNIPVVGKTQVAAGRIMQWLRIDRYLTGPPEKPEGFHFQPLPCMHCENAPCEYVCPVGATVHSADGLNDMIYNRCVGTRFCSNNCPYKVRRFNFLHYADLKTPSLRLQYNPDVTVRSRGVMEKCTYCVQRIRHAGIEADTQQTPLVDGDIVTACQAACPASAIVFGDLNDPESRVKQAKDSTLNYGLLTDLNTVPRTTYLAALTNPNPELFT